MPEKKGFRYKFLKRAAGVLLLVCLVLIAGAWYLNIKYKPVLSKEIKALIFKSTDGLYTISFTNVTTNIITGHAVLKNVKILPDTNRYKALIGLKRAPNNLYQVVVKKLTVKNFHPLNVLIGKKLNIDLVLFDKPEVVMVNKQFDFNENRPVQPQKSPYDFIAKALKEFSIETIDFRDASFKYIDRNLTKPSFFSVANLDITLKDFLIDPTSAKDLSRLYLLKDVIISLNDYSYITPNKLYQVKLNHLEFSALTGALNIKKFAVEPLYSEMEFSQVAGYNKDRFQVRLNDVFLKGINLPLYVRKQELTAKSMIVSNGQISVFNADSQKRIQTESRIGSFPHQLLQKVRLPIELQKINLNNIDVHYAVYNKKSQQTGRISFEHTTGTISNLTNVAKVKARDSIMEANLITYLMGQGKLDINFKFNLTAKDGAFSYSGILHSINARIMNRITKPLGFVQINRGNVDQLAFHFDANDLKAKGKVDFSYFDLSIALMRNDAEKGRLVKRGLLSFLANALIINPENPSSSGQFISAQVDYGRPANTSFFNLIWRSLLQGIKLSIGITEEKQNKMMEHIAKFKAIKASQQERKLKRQQRRTEQLREKQ